MSKYPFKGGLRFAPSPTGRFHLGNLRTAWISHALATSLKLEWILRFEDIDKSRRLEGAQEKQLADMSALGLKTQSVYLQSENNAFHEEVFRRAVAAGFVYPCSCSRKEVQDHLRGIASAPHDGVPLYDGHCRNQRYQKPDRPEIAWRFKNPLEDTGRFDFIVARSCSDFDAKKIDFKSSFQSSYQWACALDDFFACHEWIVRAWDLEDSASQQWALQRMLSNLMNIPLKLPNVFHCALITDNNGHRLEKRSVGVTLDELLRTKTSSEIINNFELSFNLAFAERLVFRDCREKIIGEEIKTLRLSDLNLGV